MGTEQNDAWQAALRLAMDSLPADYPEAYRQISLMRKAFFAHAAAALGPRLSQHLKEIPQESYNQKRQIVHEINQQLREINLCCVCPITKNPSSLYADCRDDETRTSRFRFKSTDDEGRVFRKHSTKRLGDLELTEAPHREEGLANRRTGRGV